MLLAATLAGAAASFVTNGIEVLAVHKQTDREFRVMNFLRQKGSIRTMFLQGVHVRTLYYSLQACGLFYTFEKAKTFLSVNHFVDD